MFPNDNEYESHIIEKVEPMEGGWLIRMDNGWSTYVPHSSPVQPEKGDTIRLYGQGIGHVIQGMFINGRCVYYRSKSEAEARIKFQCEHR